MALSEDILKKEWMIPYNSLKLEKEIGRGSYGKVYMASYLGTEVAVKKIANIDDDEIQLLTEREVTLLRDMRHPNIVQFMGIVQHSSGFYIVTEYVPKGALRKWLKDERIDISWKMRINMALDVARAMAYLHSKNVIHRDLKSKNLLVDENVRIKVCDFGLAREYDPNRAMSMAGTDAWIAPEVLLSLDYDYKCDVFSYGVVLAEIITRKKPNDKVLRRHLPDYHIDEAELRSLTPKDCPKAFLDLTIECINVDQDRRPDFPTIADRLKAMLADAPDGAAGGGRERKKSAAGTRKKSSAKSGKSRKREQSPSVQQPVRWEIFKLNKFGSKQARIMELDASNGFVKNYSRDGELKKQFLTTAIRQVVKHNKEKLRARIDFHERTDQRPYDLEFLTTEDREDFCNKIASMMAKTS